MSLSTWMTSSTAPKTKWTMSTKVGYVGYVVGQGSIQMDPAKVSLSTVWSTSKTQNWLQRVLSFTSFYCCFIQRYSMVAVPFNLMDRF